MAKHTGHFLLITTKYTVVRQKYILAGQGVSDTKFEREKNGTSVVEFSYNEKKKNKIKI